MVAGRRSRTARLLRISAAASSLWALISGSGSAERFVNSYIAFELPDGWLCELEVTEWVCRPRDPIGSLETIFILTAKETGPQDQLHLYEDHLMRPKQIESQSGVAILSTIHDLGRRQIGGRTWVVGTHFQSEVPNYFTRYFATVDNQIAVLFTFSAHRDYFDRWANEVLPALESLEVQSPR